MKHSKKKSRLSSNPVLIVSSNFSIILSGVFFILFFIGLNHFFSNKMKSLNSVLVLMEQSSSLTLSSKSILNLRAKSNNKQLIAYYQLKDSERIKNTRQYKQFLEFDPNINENERENMLEYLQKQEGGNISRSLLTIPRSIISGQASDLTQYKFKDKFCNKADVKNVAIFPLNGAAEYLVKTSLYMETRFTNTGQDLKNKETFKNRLRVCQSEINSLIVSNLEKTHLKHYISYSNLIKKQMFFLKDKYELFKNIDIAEDSKRQKKQQDQYIKNLIVEFEYYISEVNTFIKDRDKKIKLFEIADRKLDSNITFRLEKSINVYSIFFVISLMASILFYITILLFKKKYSINL